VSYLLSFIKDEPEFPLLKRIHKGASEAPPLAFREFKRLIIAVGNITQQKRPEV